MSAKKLEYTSSLDSVFNRLQVSSYSCGEERTSQQQHSTNKVSEDDHRLNQTIGARLKANQKKRANKCVVRKAKLVLPRTVHPKQSANTSNLDDETSDDDEKCVDETQSETYLSGASVASCSVQYLQQQVTTSTGQPPTADPAHSNPDELASYFEQILFIPKPMSLMAQMMYA